MERNRNMRVLVALIAGVAIVTVWMVWHSVALAQSGLEISKVVDHTDVSPGRVITYTITVTNTSGEPLSNVVITDELSSALEFVAASPELSMEGQLLTWRIDSLPVSSTHKITLSARVGQGASGVIMNTAHVSAEGVPPRFDEAEIHIRAQEPSPTSTPISSTQITEQLADLHVRVADVSPLPIQPGGKITIVIEYHNAGSGVAENVSLQVSFDPLDAMRVEGGEARELGTLPPGHQGSLILQGTVRDQLSSLGQITVMVSLASTTPLRGGQQPNDIRIIEVQQTLPVETLVPAPTASPTPSPASPPPTSTPAPPPSDGAKKFLLLFGIGALMLALLIVIVFLLLRLFRGWKKSSVARPTRPLVSALTMPYLESIGYQGQQQRFPLDKSVIRIGRAEDNDIVITDRFQGWDTVSRVHATIERDGARYVIVDQGSLNGVYVNGRRTGRNLLRDGWKVAIGAVEFIYHQPPTPSQPD